MYIYTFGFRTQIWAIRNNLSINLTQSFYTLNGSRTSSIHCRYYLINVYTDYCTRYSALFGLYHVPRVRSKVALVYNVYMKNQIVTNGLIAVIDSND